MEALRTQLMAMGEAPLRAFNAKLIPTVPAESILGIRIPALRAMAARLLKEEPALRQAFLQSLPHAYLEENLLHALFINQEKAFPDATAWLDAFLPHVDNWAVCDILSPKAWKKSPEEAMPVIEAWLSDPHPYTVRFAMGQLMQLCSKSSFRPAHLSLIQAAITDHYYVMMMASWYYAEVMAHHSETVYAFLQDAALPPFVRRKSIQKALESRKITPSWKESLRSLRETIR